MAKTKISAVIYLAMDFRWRVVVDFPNWFQITLPRSYANKRMAREGVERFAERFGLKIGEIEVKDGPP